ncbi:fatty acyl-CoA reductase 1 [Dermacentor silvarum]|uniref:fatty acyl-CoA reductase 1 n=1 Tax=Dermacentor silvarum TaxID=543639 RepID=UPI002100C9A8|nr:fatty acyl-CoA reductase 1 [Dermacentor silvarum]
MIVQECRVLGALIMHRVKTNFPQAKAFDLRQRHNPGVTARCKDTHCLALSQEDAVRICERQTSSSEQGFDTSLRLCRLTVPAKTVKVLKPQQSLTSTMVDEWKDGSQVAGFYQGRVVFITGGTGFIGKVLLEKLLRSCSGLKRVYLLVRSKRGENPQARLEKLFDSQMFERLKQEQPDAFEKVTALEGDLSEPNLGLSVLDQAALVNSVSVVFHSGATVKFDEPLRQLTGKRCACVLCSRVSDVKSFHFRKAAELNILGTRRVLDLCKQMPNICAFVHVSTAYCNPEKQEVLEIIYPPPIGADKLVAAIQCTNKDGTGPKEDCLFGLPNTYTLTKRVAESLLLEERGDIPVAIVRPSIVSASIREPLPGWVDNYNGCTGIIVTVGLGLLQSVLAKKKSVVDFIPVDVVTNMLICAAWHIAETRPKHIEVYHCTSGALTPHTWIHMAGRMQRAMLRTPLPNALRYPKFHMTGNQQWHNINLWCFHYLPACVVDLALQLCGQKPRFVHLYQKICKGMNSLQYFMTHEWLFRSNNALELLQELSPTDAQASIIYKWALRWCDGATAAIRFRVFNFDVRRLEWSPYFEGYMLGIRKYLLKVEDSELPQARKHLRRLNAVRWFGYLALVAIPWGLVATLTTWDVCCSVRGFATGLCDMLGFQWLL